MKIPWLLFLCPVLLAHAQSQASYLSFAIPKPTTPGVTRYRARIAYDGAGFQGFQIQPDARTIQVSEKETISCWLLHSRNCFCQTWALSLRTTNESEHARMTQKSG